MPKHKLRVQPYNDQLFPHETFPPWLEIERIFAVIARALARPSPEPSNLRLLQSPLAEAAERIIVVAGGGLPVHRWHRRVRVTIDYLERARAALDRYVAADALTDGEADSIEEGIERTIAALVDAVDKTPLPDELRTMLPELRVVH